MSSFNLVVLMGNLTRDVELRYTPNGTAVCDLGLAVNDRRKDAKGEWVDEVTFVDVTLFGRTAEVAGEYLRKGSQVLIEGKLKLDQWQDQQGNRKQKLKVMCERMQMTGSKRGGNGGGDGQQEGSGGSQRQQTRRQEQPAGSRRQDDQFDPPAGGDDIPF